MPLFRYICQDCETDAELLIRRSGETPVCPKCESTHMLKQMSAFAPVSGSGPEPVGCGAASCCQLQGGGCMN